jgi:hypothetical protein
MMMMMMMINVMMNYEEILDYVIHNMMKNDDRLYQMFDICNEHYIHHESKV